jgi:polysaccharide export outer membrane protein
MAEPVIEIEEILLGSSNWVQGDKQDAPSDIRECFIKCLAISIMAIALATSASAQQQASPIYAQGSTSLGESSNLPVEKIGRDDLVGITVYDAPELTRTVRVGFDGDLRLPMLKQHIHAADLYPAELENAITAALVDENVMVEPIVTVSVVEVRSRPITVAGAVRSPITFQATGSVTLLDAISRAGGISDNAGPEILVSHPPLSTDGKSITLTERILARSLLNEEDQTSNLKLEGGEVIRIPEAGRFFVAGNVKHPGMFSITDGSESSVLKAVALSEGLDNYSGHIAYIYRIDGSSGRKNEIPIDVKKILARKSPDVPLYANDMLYVPNSTGLRASAKAVEIVLATGLGVASLLLVTVR